jgi:hypothetical protein
MPAAGLVQAPSENASSSMAANGARASWEPTLTSGRATPAVVAARAAIGARRRKATGAVASSANAASNPRWSAASTPGANPGAHTSSCP